MDGTFSSSFSECLHRNQSFCSPFLVRLREEEEEEEEEEKSELAMASNGNKKLLDMAKKNRSLQQQL